MSTSTTTKRQRFKIEADSGEEVLLTTPLISAAEERALPNGFRSVWRYKKIQDTNDFPKGWFFIKSALHGFVFDVQNSSTHAGAEVVLTCLRSEDYASQLWTYRKGYIINLKSRLVIDVCADNKESYWPLIQNPAKAGDRVFQRWGVNPQEYIFSLTQKSLCLTPKDLVLGGKTSLEIFLTEVKQPKEHREQHPECHWTFLVPIFPKKGKGRKKPSTSVPSSTDLVGATATTVVIAEAEKKDAAVAIGGAVVAGAVGAGILAKDGAIGAGNLNLVKEGVVGLVHGATYAGSAVVKTGDVAGTVLKDTAGVIGDAAIITTVAAGAAAVGAVKLGKGAAGKVNEKILSLTDAKEEIVTIGQTEVVKVEEEDVVVGGDSSTKKVEEIVEVITETDTITTVEELGVSLGDKEGVDIGEVGQETVIVGEKVDVAALRGVVIGSGNETSVTEIIKEIDIVKEVDIVAEKVDVAGPSGIIIGSGSGTSVTEIIKEADIVEEKTAEIVGGVAIAQKDMPKSDGSWFGAIAGVVGGVAVAGGSVASGAVHGVADGAKFVRGTAYDEIKVVGSGVAIVGSDAINVTKSIGSAVGSGVVTVGSGAIDVTKSVGSAVVSGVVSGVVASGIGTSISAGISVVGPGVKDEVVDVSDKVNVATLLENESASRSYTFPDVRYSLWFEKRKDEKEIDAIAMQHNMRIKPERNDDCLSYKISGARNTIDKAFASFKTYADKVISELQSSPVRIDRQRAEIILAQRDKVTKIEQQHCVEILPPEMDFGVIIPATNQAIELVYGDIAHEAVDAIVSSASARLEHGRGIAKVIADAAGQQLRDECKNYIAQHGTMTKGHAIVTTAGDLQTKGVKYVIHVNGPVWSSGTKKKEELLHAAITNALLLANTKGCKTVALPPISMGLSGFPHEKGAKIIVNAVMRTLPKTQIHKVRIIDFKPEQAVKGAPTKDREGVNLEGVNQQNSTEVYRILRKVLSEKWKEIENDEITTGLGDSSVLSMPTSQPLRYQWFWKEDVQGKHYKGEQWIKYDRDQNITIENAYNKWSAPGPARASIPVITSVKIVGGVTSVVTYEILFGEQGHVQRNTSTNYQRSIMRKDITIPITNPTPAMPTFQSLPYQWFWKEDVRGKHYKGEQWIKYDRDQNIDIENAYNKWCAPGAVSASIPMVAAVGVNYEILFSKEGHFQKNTNTNYKRSIMRKDITIPIMANADLPSTQVTSNNGKNPTPVDYKYWKELVEIVITGACVDTAAAAKELESLVKLKTEFIPMTGPWEKIDLAEREATIWMIAGRLYVDVEFNSKENTIKLMGHEGFVDTTLAEVYKWAFDKSANIEKELPKDWDKFDEKVNCLLVPLSATSKEWQTVVARVCQTMPHASIQKIERVQNRHLWFEYQHNHRQLSNKNGGLVNVRSLFHGTRSTLPSDIYESEEGFDPRFSAKGMWGNGCYFAVNASYSDRYAFVSENKQFLLADVITGDSITLPPDNLITFPPAKAKQTGNFKNERYDSVNGITNGSNVYIVYSPGRFYPKYLITYK